jgi:hypothetical protein
MKKSNLIVVRITQGAGLSFPIACLLYVLSGQLVSFALIPVGAAIGFAVGLVHTRQPATDGKMDKSRSKNRWITSVRRSLAPLSSALLHENGVIRFVSLLLFGSALLLLTWIIGYYLLPERLFRSGAEVHMERAALDTASRSVFEEWMKINRENFVPVLIIILGSMLIRVYGIPFGYIVALYNLALYGLYIGTNSFAIPHPERMALSFGILQRSGPYEMIVLMLLAAATCSWSFFEIKSSSNPGRAIPPPRFKVQDIVTVILGISLLLAANYVEAYMIVSSISSWAMIRGFPGINFFSNYRSS